MIMCVEVFMLHTHTCVLVEGEESRTSSRYYTVGHPAILSSIRIIGCYLDNGGTWSTMGTKADCVEGWIEGRPVVINIYH